MQHHGPAGHRPVLRRAEAFELAGQRPFGGPAGFEQSEPEFHPQHAADRVVHRRYVISRVHAQYLEPRGVVGVYDPGEDRYTLYADVQYPHRVRTALASNIFQVPEHRIRVIAGDVGGGFGTKGWQYPEHRLVLWAARRLGRPGKWVCERREAIPADEHARDNVTEAELALDADGRFLGLRVRTLANVGAYVSSDRNLLATFSNVPTLAGVCLGLWGAGGILRTGRLRDYVWAAVGLVPAVMFVTGLIMWWNRVVRRRRTTSEVIA